MGKIGDLWVRLGLKKDEYSAGLKQAEKEAGSFGKSVTSISGKAKVAFAAVAAGVAAVVATVKDLAKQNQMLGDAWNRMTAGMAAGWDTFKTAVASMDFSHLLSNMREASRMAKELYNAQDALGEITTAYNIELARQADTINNKRVDLANPNLTKEQRLAAGQDLLNIYTNLEKGPTRGLERAAGASLDKIAQKLGYQMQGASEEALKATRKEVENFFVWLGSEAGEAWNKAYADAAADPSKLMQTNINAQNAGLSDNYRALLYNYQTKIGDKDRLAMEDAVVKYYQQQAMVSAETLRIRKQMNSIEHESADTADKPDTGRAGALQKELELLEQEEKEIAAVDRAMEEAANNEYNRWRAANGFNAEPIGLDNEELLMYAQALQEVIRYEKELADVSDMLAANQDEINARLTANLQDLGKVSEDVARTITEQLISAIEDGLVSSFGTLANVMAGVTDGGMEQVAKALLEPLADMAIRAGTLIMMSGEAIAALRESLIGFFGGNAIVAGAALVAVGLAAKAGLAAIGNKGSGSSVTSMGSASSLATAPTTQTAELVVHVEGTVKGSDIILAGNNTLNSWGR